MELGTVIKWEKYPFPRHDRKIKPRWFVYLGHTDIFSLPIQYYLATTTTSETRILSPTDGCLLSVNKFTFFDCDCYIDYHERPHILLKNQVEKNSAVEKVGKLDEPILKVIYGGIRNSRMYSYRAKLDIYSSFDRDDITDIEKPKIGDARAERA